MDEILNNFLIFIPIAVVVALRIVEARKKQAQNGEDPSSRFSAGLRGLRREAAEPEGGNFSGDEDEGDADEFVPFGGSGGGPPSWSPVEPPVSRELLERKERRSPLIPEISGPPALEALSSAVAFETTIPAVRSAEPPPDAKPLPDQRFPSNLDYLPPLKRALALTEILGTPRALYTEER